MTDNIAKLLLTAAWTGFALFFLSMIVKSWFDGRLRVRGLGWVTRQDNPIAFYFHIILFVIVGTAFSIFGLYVFFLGLRRVFGF